MMKIMIVPDSFKESLSAEEVAKAIKLGFEKVFPQAEYHLLPVGDGGEGTISSLSVALQLKRSHTKVTGPFGLLKEVSYVYRDKTAFFEVADITGLALIPNEKRDPLTITNVGVGELLNDLIQKGFKEIVIGVGGTSTIDGGIGLAHGMGYRFYDQKGELLEPLGKNLSRVAHFEKTSQCPDLSGIKIKVLTDVSNPLVGPRGASQVFGPQKGLPTEKITVVDSALKQFYHLINPQIFTLSGSGAGGGMAAGLVTFLRGELVSGIDEVLELLDYERLVRGADLVIVGEGRLDQQSLSGKAPIGVVRHTPKSIPIIAICGSLSDDLPELPFENIRAAFSIISKIDSPEHTFSSAKANLEYTAQNIAQLLKIAAKNPAFETGERI